MDCGCKVFTNQEKGTVRIEYCPTHAAGRELLEALRSLLETEDMNTERPPWTYQSIHRGRVGCCYCGGDGEDASSILHFDYDGGICPIARAQDVIAKTEDHD